MQKISINDYEILIQEATDYHWYSYNPKDYDKVFNLANDEESMKLY